MCRPDITARTGDALYSGTPLGRKPPFVPGYAVVGTVDAVGDGVSAVAVGDRVGALTVVGGYSEVIYWRADRLFPVPAGLDPAEAVTLILNYVVAYQALHRSAKVRPGEKVLLIGASGGIGTALLQLGQLAGLKMYGLASPAKHAILADYGAIPVDYHRPDFAEMIRQAEPSGLDAVISGVMNVDYVRAGLSLLRNRGRLVAFGEPDGFGTLFRILAASIAAKLPPGASQYGCTAPPSISLATGSRSWTTGPCCSSTCRRARSSRSSRRGSRSWRPHEPTPYSRPVQ